MRRSNGAMYNTHGTAQGYWICYPLGTMMSDLEKKFRNLIITAMMEVGTAQLRITRVDNY